MALINDYRQMANDRVRIQAYRKGILEEVKEGDKVVEIGTGLGTYAIFACQAGAARVYAIESEDIIHVAEDIARANGLEDRIVFLHGRSQRVKLPEKVDVLIFEDFSSLFVCGGVEGIYQDAKRRFLKQDGCLIPSEIFIYLAPCQAPLVYGEIDIWATKKEKVYGIDFSPTRLMVFNNYYQKRIKAEYLLGEPVRVHKISLAANDPYEFHTTVSYKIKEDGELNGIAGWFDARLSPSVMLSNSPMSPQNLWHQSFFPLSQPLRVKKDQVVEVDFSCQLPKYTREGWFNWRVKTGQQTVEGSTFRGFPLKREGLPKLSDAYKPQASLEGRIQAWILSSFNGKKSSGQIAASLRRKFPGVFRSRRQALARVVQEVENFA
ncbi:50S ribosomal protein L11 methyltransferase [candidate division KSB1 bacterium]|nr:50S ribosomal protein L11 methyltransferase [candidate division KSB1 bacterium]